MSEPYVAVVAGARPNFIKIAPVLHAVDKIRPPFSTVLVHTGQHYSAELSDVFFQQLGIRPPDIHLDAGSGSHGRQTARILDSFESFLVASPLDIAAVMVVGDVNSTIAAALAAAKLGKPVIHLEAGLRSFDRTMPEEINRLATDAISDLLLVSEPCGETNLRAEGVPPSRIRYVGNVMIDTLVAQLGAVESKTGGDESAAPFALVTLHRPSNVDSRENLTAIVEFLVRIADKLRIVFPIHPRTKSRLTDFGLTERLERAGAILLPPQGYIENLGMMSRAMLVLTDSGGIQEETSFLSVPCLTIRENTERPSTISHGTNTLVGLDFVKADALVDQIIAGSYKKGRPIPGWDGRAAYRVVESVSEFLALRHVIPPLSEVRN